MKYDDLCTNIWKYFSTDDDDEFDEDEHNLVEKVQQLKENFQKSKDELECQRQTHSSTNEQLQNSFGKLLNLFVIHFAIEPTREKKQTIRSFSLDKRFATTDNNRSSSTNSTANNRNRR